MRRKRILAGILILALLSLLLLAFYALIAASTNDQHDIERCEIGLRIASIWCTERPQETSKAETLPEPLTQAQTPASEDGSTVSAKPEAPVEVEITAQEPYQYENFRGVFHNEIYPQWMERQDWIDRVTHYCRCMGMNVSDEDMAYFVDLAIQGGYDPRLWCCFAMAENKVPPNICLLYTSDAADDLPCLDSGGPRIIKKKTTTTTQHYKRHH